jgi:hypothetical protein
MVQSGCAHSGRIRYDMYMRDTHTEITRTEKGTNMKELFAGTAIVVAVALSFASNAHAQPVGAPEMDTINLTEIDDIDVLPVCHVEDCSDVPDQHGLWYSQYRGDWLLIDNDDTWLIVDDTATDLATGPNAFDEGAYVGGYN